jgi:hypothetical protein
MRAVLLIFVFAFAACGRDSSPEGRMTIKLENMQSQHDSLKQQNVVILDSMGKINEELRKVRIK